MIKSMRPFRLYLYSQIVRWLPETRFFCLKVKLLRWCGATIGDNVRICSSATFLGVGQLVIGDDVWIGPRCFMSPNEHATIQIGAHIDIAPQVMILTATHKIEPLSEHVGGEEYTQSVTVGDGCWIGAKSILLPGVVLPKKTIVAAGSVVTKSIDDERSLLAGVPAKVVKLYK